MNTALLIPTTIEIWQPSKRCYVWVKAYKVVTPEGVELYPPMRVTGSHYEKSARQFCTSQGWKIKIANSN